MTITAGTLQQVVEGAAVIGGTYTLSWTGTAQGRVGAGSYVASPVTASGITAGANTTIEFNAGTLAQVKFEPGSASTPWMALAPGADLANCQRFYQTGNVFMQIHATAAGGYGYYVSFLVTMRAVSPGINFVSPSYTNASAVVAGSVAANGFIVTATATAAGSTAFNSAFTATADL